MQIENNLSKLIPMSNKMDFTAVLPPLQYTLTQAPIQRSIHNQIEHCLSIVCLSSGGLFLDLGILDGLGFILLASEAIIDPCVSDIISIYSIGILPIVVKETITLDKLSHFVGSMASEKKVVLWLDRQGKAHEQTRVDTQS